MAMGSAPVAMSGGAAYSVLPSMIYDWGGSLTSLLPFSISSKSSLDHAGLTQLLTSGLENLLRPFEANCVCVFFLSYILYILKLLNK